MRRLFSIVLNLAVLVSFAEAPFLHTHRHAATQQHPGPLLHLHLKSAPSRSTAPGFEGLDPNEDAQYQRWFSATPTHSVSLTPVMVAEPFVLVFLERQGAIIELPQPSGHDPPGFAPPNPRAPPA